MKEGTKTIKITLFFFNMLIGDNFFIKAPKKIVGFPYPWIQPILDKNIKKKNASWDGAWEEWREGETDGM